MKRIVLIGASGHAAVIIDAIEKRNKYQIAGLVDAAGAIGATVLSYPILGCEEDLPSLLESHGIEAALVAIGDNWTRCQVVTRIKALLPDLSFATVIHPAAAVASSAEIGAGTVVMAGSVINSRSRVGNFCIVNSGAVLEHDSELADFACLLPRAATGGDVSIGTHTAICMGANIMHGVSIGEHSVVGAGSTVLSDIPARVVAYGTPAKVIRFRTPGQKYL